ncbi:hypothetical protein M758_10G104600 [Ceratodon purpureus]|uniref:Bifunctional inhibitor/plant lipid transfer protein/seed storage helical domain-containing protein n=1 Tax=Ceratodon purpureus TaxID=3225 RepID=A0A8T0GP24_CERPU|nr:hypothetical protein KC19_10G107900 [Ceratodon purpureus]KAG0603582.1 hypothetical protein M758_10G104600 [Ceratodon purpureus]
MALSRNLAMVSTFAMLVVAFALVQQVSAQCGNVNSLVGCLGAATRGDQPTAACCNAMAAFAQYGTPAGEACLCQAINNPTAKSAGAKMQFAIQIPQKCNLNYKAGYVCNGMVVPGGHA